MSFDLLSSEMNEMLENPLLIDEELRSALRSSTPHRAVAPHREDKRPEVAPMSVAIKFLCASWLCMPEKTASLTFFSHTT